jgi:lipopolysaccharide export system protein LptA
MSRAKGLLAILVVAILVGLVFLPRGRNPASNETVARAIALYGYAEDGAPRWEIRAREGRLDGSTQALTDVAVDFHNDDGSTMSARGDRLDRTDGVGRLSGDVRIEQSGDFRMEVETLTWNEAEERLDAGPIGLSTDDLRLSAARFGYDLRAETASFEGGVEATARLETEWAIRAERAEERDGVVTFLGGVTVDAEEGRVRAESVRLDEDGILAVGGVEARLDLGGSGEPDGT